MPDLPAITSSSRPKSALCPTCGEPSRRVHSRYLRQLHGLPWQGCPATIEVQARRCRCVTASCPRRTFAGHLHAIAGRSTRRSERPGELQGHPGPAPGGAAGATAPSWSTSSVTGSSICRRTGRPRPWPPGCASLPASRSPPGIGPAPMPTASARARPMPFGWQIAGTCRAISARRSKRWSTGTMPPSSVPRSRSSASSPGRTGGDGRSAGQAHRSRDPPPRGL